MLLNFSLFDQGPDNAAAVYVYQHQHSERILLWIKTILFTLKCCLFGKNDRIIWTVLLDVVDGSSVRLQSLSVLKDSSIR